MAGEGGAVPEPDVDRHAPVAERREDVLVVGAVAGGDEGPVARTRRLGGSQLSTTIPLWTPAGRSSRTRCPSTTSRGPIVEALADGVSRTRDHRRGTPDAQIAIVERDSQGLVLDRTRAWRRARVSACRA